MNTYEFVDDYCAVTCSDGSVFVVDKDAYEIIRGINWYRHRNAIEGSLDGKVCSLAKFVSGCEGTNAVVRRKDPAVLDYRRSNLFVKNRIRIDGDTAYVETMNGIEFMIDVDDVPLIDGVLWGVDRAGYPSALISGKRIKLHRYLLGLHEWRGYNEVVDHIDRNPLNNRRCNLRIVTQRENIMNREYPAGKSGYTNIEWNEEMKCWRVHKAVQGKSYFLGAYDMLSDAQQALNDFNAAISCGTEYIPTSTHRYRRSGTGYKYVYNHKPRGWVVNVKKDGKDNYIGLFYDINEALRARDEFLAE